MKKILLFSPLFILLGLIFSPSQEVLAHCEVPCGIYNDSIRIALIKEHINTLEKSMNKVDELSTAAQPNFNQLVRWVNNKDEHAQKIQDIVSQYFLHQRIKPADPENGEAYKKYLEHLELLHRMLVYSMKCKQTTDLDFIDKLRQTVKAFEQSYFHTHDHDHKHNKNHKH